MTAKLPRHPESPQRELGWTSDLWLETSLHYSHSIRNENENKNHH